VSKHTREGINANADYNFIPRTAPGHDRLIKIRPLINSIEPLFRLFFCPKCELAIDKMAISIKGRSVLKQYNPKKS
jgi:hypothetical protein